MLRCSELTRIPEASGGMAIEVNRVLSLMSLTEASISPIYFDGLTSGVAVWKPKVEPSHSLLLDSGLLPMWIQTIGGNNQSLLQRLNNALHSEEELE